MSDLFLDSREARQRVTAGDADEPRPLGVRMPVNVAQASTPRPKLEDFGYKWADISPSASAPENSPAKPKLEDFGYKWADSPVPARASTTATPERVPPKEGVFTGLGKALVGGVEDTTGSLFSAGATLVDAKGAVVDSAQAAMARSPDEARALQAFKGDIASRQAADDSGILAGIKNVAGATFDNPEGAFQMLVSQLPNTVAALGAGAAGGATGFALGGPIGGTIGFLTGLFSANTALEIGGKAQQAARDGNFTDAERYEAMKEGVVKGGVITAVDAVTLGASKWILGTANRAVETATVRTLEAAGYDATKLATSIKQAQNEALKGTANMGREASTAALEKATFEAMVREGITDTKLVTSIRSAQSAALDGVNTIARKAGRGTAAVGLETVGEGLGEYLGELAATGKASPTEAVLEALAGLSMSVTELGGLSMLEKPGLLTSATNINAPQKEIAGGNIPLASDLNANLTSLPDLSLQTVNDAFDRRLKQNKDDTLNVIAAIYAKQLQADPTATPENNSVLKTIQDATVKLSIFSEMRSRVGDQREPTEYELSGEQILSDSPRFETQLLKELEVVATTLPRQTTPKFDNRILDTPTLNISEEDVMNAPLPDDDVGVVVNQERSPLDSKLDFVRSAENPGTEAARLIQETAYGTDNRLIAGWTASEPDRYNVITQVSPDKTERVFTHNELPDVIFNTRDDLFNAFTLLDEASKVRNQSIADKAKPAIKANEDDVLPDIDPDLLFSKDPNGKIKAVFFKDLKKVFFSKSASQIGDIPGMTTRRQFRGLEMHEIGAHYAIERMVGSTEYQRLLTEMSKLKGMDNFMTEAYNSVPADTIPALIDHEALGYLVENYESNNFVQRFFQMVKDWYAKNFNGQELTSTDLLNTVRAAYQIHSKEVARVYLKDNISATPKAGTKRVVFQDALQSTPEAHKFLDFVNQFKDDLALSGSLAIAAQKPIFRPVQTQVHDLDFTVSNKDKLPEILGAINQQYPDSAISSQFSSRRTKADVISITLNKNDPKSLTVDFFTKLGGESMEVTNPVQQTYTGADGQSRSVTLLSADAVFDKKMAMNRVKDVNDALQSEAFDVAFSKTPSDGTPKTKDDLVKVLPKVIEAIRNSTTETLSASELKEIIEERMSIKPEWAALIDKLTLTDVILSSVPKSEKPKPQRVKTAEFIPSGMEAGLASSTDTDEATVKGTFVKAKAARRSKEEIAEDKRKETERVAEEQKAAEKSKAFFEQRNKETPKEQLLKEATNSKIKKIYTDNTRADFFQNVVNKLLGAIASIEKRIQESNSYVDEDGTRFRRLRDEQDGMENQIESTGRVSSGEEYYQKELEATFSSPDSIKSLLARKKILDLELQNAMSEKVSKQAKQGKLAIRAIRREISEAIDDAVKNGLPINMARELQEEYITGIDNYLKLGNITAAEKKAEEVKEMQEFMDQMNKSAQEVTLPSDTEFAFKVLSDLQSKKINVAQAVDLIEQADLRKELENKKSFVSKILSGLITDYKIVYDEKLRGEQLLGSKFSRLPEDQFDLQESVWSNHPASNILFKYKKDGTIRFDDIQNLFAENNTDMPHSVVKTSEIAASKGLLDFMRENNHNPSFKFYWLGSMDRVVTSNKSVLDSFMYTDLERDLYQEYKSETGAIKNRLRNATQVQNRNYGNLLFNRFSLDQMRNPDSLPSNTRMQLQQMYPDLTDAYFSDIYFANNNGYGKQAADVLSAEDRRLFDNWLDRRSKANADASARLERKQYFTQLSQFKHIDDETFNALYKMMRDDSVSNLPMIFEMAQTIQNAAMNDQGVDLDTGALMPKQALLYKQLQDKKAEEAKKSGDVTVTRADLDTQDEADAFEQTVMSAYVRSQMGEKGVGSSSLKRDPVFDFNTYKESNGSRLVSYEENSGDQNASNVDDESVAEQMMYGIDIDMQDMTSQEQDSQVDEDPDAEDPRLRQGQYSGFLSTALVMNYVSQITKNWKNAPNIVVLQSHLQLPEGIREDVAAKLRNGMGAKGLFDGSTGTIYLFSNYLSSKDDAQFTLFHEAYGHLGLRLMFGKDFDVFLDNMYKSSPAVKYETDLLMAKGGMGRLEAIEETLSEFAGDNRENSIVKDFFGKVISSLRKIGLDRVANYIGGFTDSELAYSLKAARKYAQNFAGYSPLSGGPTDIRLSSDRPPYEIFAKKATFTTGYARYDPLSGQYYVYVVPVGVTDIRQSSKMLIKNSLEDVIKELTPYGTLERRVRSGLYTDNTIPEDFVRFINSRQKGYWEGLRDSIQRMTQNQYLPVFRLVEQMEREGRVTGNLDLRKFLRTTERQSAVMTEDFKNNYVLKIMDLLAKAEKNKGTYIEGATNVYSMLNKFLLAQTAEERNKAVNNKDGTNFAGSGMASASSVEVDPVKYPEDTATKILDFVKTQPYSQEFEKIGILLNKMSDAKMDWEVKSGLLTQTEADLRRKAYKFYRNLSGVNSKLDEDYSTDPSLNIFKKFNVRGKDKNALGRADEAPDILARTIVAAEASIIRGNKNLVAQKVLNFFETNYDPNFVSINEQAYSKRLGDDGFVTFEQKAGYYSQPDVFVAKVKGIPVTIRFKDAGPNSIKEALHGKVEPQSEHPVRHVMQLMGRTTGALITKYNPFWIPVNFVRDVQTLFFNAGVNGTVGWRLAGQMGKALLPAIGTSARVALMDMRVTTDAGKAAKNMLLGLFKPNEEMLKHYMEGRKAGAFTSFINNKNLEDQIIEINEAINGTSVIGKVQGFFKFWELITLPVEMAPRLAAYSTMVKNGRSVLDAADYAGGVTVDFNMRGSDEWLRAAYLFFNPAVQGTAQIAKLAKDNPARFGAVAAGLMSLGFLTSMLGRMQGDDEDEKKRKRKEAGLSELDPVPDYKRGTSIILFPETRGGAIPLAYGWNAFFAAGVFAADSIYGNVPVSLSIKRTLQAAFEAFSPVGGGGFDMTKVASDPGGQVLNLVMPTVLAPMSQWYTNTNRHGGPIYPDSQFAGQSGRSDVTKAFSSVNPVSRWLVENVQEATGGNRLNQKGIDINPALVDHLVQSYVPGLITEAYKGAGVAIRKARGEEMARDKEPFFDRFSAYGMESFNAAAFRRVQEKVDGVYEEYSLTTSNNPRKQDILRAHPEIGRMKNLTDSVEKEMRSGRKDIRDMEERAYVLKQSGYITEANKMDAAAVDLRNKTKKYEKQMLETVVIQAAKSGFSREVYSD
jgi:hypothetical protein